jgi:hypothetical protein
MNKEIRYVCKDESWIMKLLSFFDPSFKIMWTTFRHTIYYPVGTEHYMDDKWKQIRSHEGMHVAQFDRYGVILMAIFYLIFPLPCIFTGRWFIERHPYLEDIKAKSITIDQAVFNLSSFYFWPWPQSLMKRWFQKHL